jgi:predicted metal-binding protein
MSVVLTVCVTCKFAEGQAFDANGTTGGELLAAAIEDGAAHRRGAPQVVRHECLWACAHSCAVLIESRGRTGYLAGRFAPDAAAAEALLDWSEAYGQTPDGEVPYARWPQGMKGHFIARIPISLATEGER